MARYCHALDACDFNGVAGLFLEDGVWTTDYGTASGRQEIAAFLSSVVPTKGNGPQCKHYITDTVIKVEGRSASAVSESEHGLIPVMGGTYKDEFIELAGRWYFSRKFLIHDIAGDMGLLNDR
jgi:uncharacterized protein (TIGR02246 family)